MKKIFVSISLFLFVSCSFNSQTTVKSPDSSISLDFQLSNDQPFYTIKKNKKVVIEKSLLGLILENKLDFSSGFKIQETSNSSYSDSWAPSFGEESNIINEYNQLSIILHKDSLEMKLIFRVFDDGVAFKYEIPNQTGIPSYDIIDEKPNLIYHQMIRHGGYLLFHIEDTNFFMLILQLIVYQKNIFLIV